MTDPALEAKAARVQAQAAALPSLEEIRDLAERAIRHGGTPDMSLEEIRAVGADAVHGAEQVTTLLRRLTVLLGGSEPPDGGVT